MSAPQSYDNHAHRPKLFTVGFLAWFAAVVAFVLVLFGYNAQGSMVALLLVGLFCALGMGRVYIVALQDRIIKLEMRVRAQSLLTPAQQTALSGLSNKQVVALRFASDSELPALLDRAVAESLTPDQIKKAVRNWQPDHDRT